MPSACLPAQTHVSRRLSPCSRGFLNRGPQVRFLPRARVYQRKRLAGSTEEGVVVAMLWPALPAWLKPPWSVADTGRHGAEDPHRRAEDPDRRGYRSHFGPAPRRGPRRATLGAPPVQGCGDLDVREQTPAETSLSRARSTCSGGFLNRGPQVRFLPRAPGSCRVPGDAGHSGITSPPHPGVT